MLRSPRSAPDGAPPGPPAPGTLVGERRFWPFVTAWLFVTTWLFVTAGSTTRPWPSPGSTAPESPGGDPRRSALLFAGLQPTGSPVVDEDRSADTIRDVSGVHVVRHRPDGWGGRDADVAPGPPGA